MPHSPLPTKNLGDADAWPFEDGADEIVIRVSRYKDDLKTPASFQAIVRGQDRTKLWGVGVRANPVAAIQAAIESFFRPSGGPSQAEITAEEQAIRRDRPRGPEADLDLEDLLS